MGKGLDDLARPQSSNPDTQPPPGISQFKWSGVSSVHSTPVQSGTAPRVFMKILHPVVTLLKEMGIHCVLYLNDILLMSQCREEA